MKWGLLLAMVLSIGLALGCSDDQGAQSGPESSAKPPAPPAVPVVEEPVTPPKVLTQVELIEAGRSVFMANCIACHNVDPAKDGALGPAVAGSSPELLEARVLRAKYPEGYKPKRDTLVMIPLRHLEPKLKELGAYLNSVE